MEFNIYFVAALGGVILFAFAVGEFIWHRTRGVTRRWIRAEIISLLRNDDTPVAVYAHQAQEKAEQAVQKVGEVQDEMRVGFQNVREDIREMRSLVLGHITDKASHSGN